MREFDSIDAFAAYLLTRRAALPEAQTRGLENAARVIEAEAKAEIGTYQEAVGPFAAWEELADSTKADRRSKGWPDNKPLLRDGTLMHSVTHEVEDNKAVVGVPSREVQMDGKSVDIGDVAIWQEFGTAGRRGMAGDLSGSIPPRRFLGGAAVRKAEEAANEVGRAVAHCIAGLPAPELIVR